MNEIYILCVEDEPYVLDAIVRDISELEKIFPVETANSAQDARLVINEIKQLGQKVGLVICDHVMPGDSGVDLLIEMQNDLFTSDTRKVLLTGQAGHAETIEAVNRARLHHYISKPWKREELLAVAREQLTQFVIAQDINLLPFMEVLDASRLQEAIRQKGYL